MGMVDPIEPMSAKLRFKMKMGTGMHFDEEIRPEDLYNARYASQWFEAAYMSLLELFRPLGVSASEKSVMVPPIMNSIQRMYESDDYKEALKN